MVTLVTILGILWDPFFSVRQLRKYTYYRTLLD